MHRARRRQRCRFGLVVIAALAGLAAGCGSDGPTASGSPAASDGPDGAVAGLTADRVSLDRLLAEGDLPDGYAAVVRSLPYDFLPGDEADTDEFRAPAFRSQGDWTEHYRAAGFEPGIDGTEPWPSFGVLHAVDDTGAERNAEPVAFGSTSFLSSIGDSASAVCGIDEHVWLFDEAWAPAAAVNEHLDKVRAGRTPADGRPFSIALVGSVVDDLDSADVVDGVGDAAAVTRQEGPWGLVEVWSIAAGSALVTVFGTCSSTDLVDAWAALDVEGLAARAVELLHAP